MEDEGVLFEGLRLGSAQAFEELLRADDATMRRVAALYVPGSQVAPLVRQAWTVALPGLDMFTWHTSLRAWLTGILVGYGRARTTAAAPATPATLQVQQQPTPDRRTTDPLPWASLGWSGLWPQESWAVLEDALGARPLEQREVLWLHDVEGWPWREVLDTLGLTAEHGAQLQHGGRSALARTVVEHVGGDPGGDEQQRLDGVAALLAALRPAPSPAPPDPQLLHVFTTWRRHTGVAAWRRWWWELERSRRARRP